MERGPPIGATATATPCQATEIAAELLAGLGVVGVGTAGAAPTTPAEDWASSGVAALTGRPGGPDLVPVGAPATVARALGLAIAALGGPDSGGAMALGARVEHLPLRRGGTRSAGGAARLLPAADGWIALSLPRAADRELVAALVGAESGGDPWAAAAAWARARPVGEAVARGALLGLALSAAGEHRAASLPWTIVPMAADTAVASPSRPRVVNLGALWAAPLCAHLLHRHGWEVTDVTATGRPTAGSPALRDLFQVGHRRLTVDLAGDAGRRALAARLADADIVIEASRPRALRQLGLDAATVMADGRPRTWLRITGHGPDSERPAFGDDAAAAGGLLAWDAAGPVFAGDALADPLTGLTAALLALAAARTPGSRIADVPMAGVAAWAASADRVTGRRGRG